ncbi:MAG: putative pterin-4-alpha-carbinolamine dehydratase [Prosthecobacter sp.]|nr:putative pterin-4-alpha-carbinolamine dehydratase [Prosthecobacter sp.]
MKHRLLTPGELEEALASMSGWTLEAGELAKEFRFASYLEGAAFVRRLAEKAEAMNHHPDLHLGWRKVRMRVSTHSAGGLTELDFSLAREADRLHASI